jgi:hypothetical protein
VNTSRTTVSVPLSACTTTWPGTPEAAAFAAYSWSGRSIKYHREQIRDAFGFREFTRGDEDKLAGWLAEEVCPVELRDQQLREALLVRCRSERIEPVPCQNSVPGRELEFRSWRRSWNDRGPCCFGCYI